METNKELWEECEKLVSMMKVCKDTDESKTFVQTIAEHEEKLEERELPLAFRTACEPASDKHWRYKQAEQYSDEWFCTRSREGEVLYAFRCFYICLAGAAEWPCMTVIPSKAWSTLAIVKRYCVCCGGTYQKTKFGLVIEIQIQGKWWYYVKADIPPDLDDLHPMSLEQTLMPAGPRHLVAMLEHVAPHKHEILTPITEDDVRHGPKTKFGQNACKITPTDYEALPSFDWQH
jgi:hypothetical protein